MQDTTMLKFCYVLEQTAPVFYEFNGKFIRDPAEKEQFKHFEENELPHAPMIKDFLQENFGMKPFPIPALAVRWATAFVSILVGLLGKKAIYYMEYRFEKKAVKAYVNLGKNSNNPKVKEFARYLQVEEEPHRDYFMAKLGVK